MFERIKKSLKNSKGFTLIELIVVVAILGVLAGVAAPNVTGAVKKSQITADLANASVIANSALRGIAEEKDWSKIDGHTDVANVSWVTDNLNGVPKTKYKAQYYGAQDDHFYITVTSAGKVTVYVYTGDSTYTQLYPTPTGAWAEVE